MGWARGIAQVAEGSGYGEKLKLKFTAKFFGKNQPVDTIMQVAGFVNPEWLVEFEADAVISDGSPPVEIAPA